jgi:dihydrofolate reductase
MRKIIASMWTTLDNFVAGPNDEMDWLRIDDQVMAYEQSFVDDAEMLLLGRSTFGDFAGYWPKAARNPHSDPTERRYAQRVDAMKKVVVSASGKVAQWRNSEVLSALSEKDVAALKHEGEGNIAIYGSLSVIGTLTRLGAIDEFHLLVHPIVLGAGKTMFEKAAPVSLELSSAKPFNSGVVLMKYGLGENSPTSAVR